MNIVHRLKRLLVNRPKSTTETRNKIREREWQQQLDEAKRIDNENRVREAMALDAKYPDQVVWKSTPKEASWDEITTNLRKIKTGS